MYAMTQFEYPLPEIACETDKIYLETSKSFNGSFEITNAGGGVLNGFINSGIESVTFSPATFSGNQVEISYYFNLESFKQGETIESSAIIISNGGEIVIPIYIEIISPEIYAKDGTKISSLMDFMFYSKANPVLSRQLFMQKEFMMWLLSMKYEYLDIYERFLMDANKERAVDNFLILNKLKRKATLSLVCKEIKISSKNNDNSPITGVIPISMIGWGYVDLNLKLKHENQYLKLLTDRIFSTDFDESGFFEATFVIYPALIKNRVTIENIECSGSLNESFRVVIVKERDITIKLSKYSYDFNDSGFLIVENNTGKDIRLEVLAKDSFVRFEGKRYFINNHAEIPFTVKLTALQLAQFTFRKQPFVISEILVRSASEYIRYDDKAELVIGNI